MHSSLTSGAYSCAPAMTGQYNRLPSPPVSAVSSSNSASQSLSPLEAALLDAAAAQFPMPPRSCNSSNALQTTSSRLPLGPGAISLVDDEPEACPSTTPKAQKHFKPPTSGTRFRPYTPPAHLLLLSAKRSQSLNSPLAVAAHKESPHVPPIYVPSQSQLSRISGVPSPSLQAPYCSVNPATTPTSPSPHCRASSGIQHHIQPPFGYHQSPQGLSAAASNETNRLGYMCSRRGCDQEFSSPWILSTHEKQHDTGRRFQCSKCTLSFVRRYDLGRHEKSVHAVKEGSPLFACGQCGQGFGRVDSLKRHVGACRGKRDV